jgi:uncharacterized protein
MELSGTHRFAAPRQVVWDALHNSAVLQKCIPGAEEVAWQGESPINGTYGGQLQVLEHTPPGHIKVALKRSIIDASASVDLTDDGTGTLATYSGTATLGGGLSALDNVLGRQMAQGALGQFFKNFEAAI